MTAVTTEGATRLVLAYNPSEARRAPLHLAVSDDGGATWADAAVLEAGAYNRPLFSST
jgi:hypothetical protein